MGRFPTSWWDSDDLVTDTIEFPIDGLAPCEYTLIVGLYALKSGQRPTTAAGDSAEIGRVTVVE